MVACKSKEINHSAVHVPSLCCHMFMHYPRGGVGRPIQTYFPITLPASSNVTPQPYLSSISASSDTGEFIYRVGVLSKVQKTGLIGCKIQKQTMFTSMLRRKHIQNARASCRIKLHTSATLQKIQRKILHKFTQKFLNI
jgi:hypothetical protein